MNKQPSQENCTDCQPSNTSIPGAIGRLTEGMDDHQSNSDKFTYNDGQGVKNKVVLTGPLSELLSQQLAITFAKTPLGDPKEPTNDPSTQEAELPVVTGLNQAAETYAIDAAVAEAFDVLENQQDNQVLLQNFDIKSLKEHLERMDAGVSNDHDRLESAGKVSALLVGTSKELLEADYDAINYATAVDELDLLLIKEITPGDQTEMSYQDAEKVKSVINGRAPIWAPRTMPDEAVEDHDEAVLAVESIIEDLTGRQLKVYTSMKQYLQDKSIG